MVNNPLITPYFFGGGRWHWGAPLNFHDEFDEALRCFTVAAKQWPFGEMSVWHLFGATWGENMKTENQHQNRALQTTFKSIGKCTCLLAGGEVKL